MGEGAPSLDRCLVFLLGEYWEMVMSEGSILSTKMDTGVDRNSRVMSAQVWEMQ